jgi:hypothetical protein
MDCGGEERRRAASSGFAKSTTANCSTPFKK